MSSKLYYRIKGLVKDTSSTPTVVSINATGNITADQVVDNSLFVVDNTGGSIVLTLPTSSDIIDANVGAPFKVGDVIALQFVTLHTTTNTLTVNAPGGSDTGTTGGFVGYGATIGLQFTAVGGTPGYKVVTLE